ncbi:MAG: BlaI/MecI/CopY family transcriptional regulator [Planctomycetota bacterium]|nr:BlaI/MecI/CopY family transcriptional regulator [Planctomycetota bacterium]
MKLNDSEWTVMQAVWESSPASARTVLERVHAETDWAYTTVKTILARLVEKGALHEEKHGRTSVYEPLVTRESARKTAVRSLLDKAFDGTFGSLVQHMVASEKLGKKEREKLARMLAEFDRKERGS